MSLDVKRAEIRKLEERARQREEALKKSEAMLEEDAQRHVQGDSAGQLLLPAHAMLREGSTGGSAVI